VGDGKGHRRGEADGDWDAIDIEISSADVTPTTDAHALRLDRRELVELDAELDSAFVQIDTPAPIDSTRMAALGHTPLPLTPLSTPVPGSHVSAPRSSISTLSCPTCSGPVDVKSPHVAVSGGAVRVYCSQLCLDQRDAPPVEANTASLVVPRKSRKIWWFAATLFVGAGCAAAFYLSRSLRERKEASLEPPAPAVSVVHMPAEPTPPVTADPQKEADAALTAELMHDAWIHPLAGPKRRMPVNHNGAFGAARAGERPIECVSGHCGVDVGRVWGEHVYAVHDGVIEWVNRGPNDEHGGVFVRIAHRDGTLFSWYFHLAAVPRWVRPGVPVRAGQVIGVLGDTGIKHSAPHLHFALSVRTSKHTYERYLDPEPLIAIWPLWIPNESRTGGRVSTDPEPGMPVRAGGKRRPRAAPATVAAPAAAAPEPAAPAETN
jgi:murein DD-endopeptidase MepM/ murein hydrolase activator NlpD